MYLIDSKRAKVGDYFKVGTHFYKIVKTEKGYNAINELDGHLYTSGLNTLSQLIDICKFFSDEFYSDTKIEPLFKLTERDNEKYGKLLKYNCFKNTNIIRKTKSNERKIIAQSFNLIQNSRKRTTISICSKYDDKDYNLEQITLNKEGLLDLVSSLEKLIDNMED